KCFIRKHLYYIAPLGWRLYKGGNGFPQPFLVEKLRMKVFSALLVVPLILASGCATRSTAARHPIESAVLSGKPGERVVVRTTAYTRSEPGGHKNGIDGRLRFGGDVYSAATDWSWMPLGTRFRIVSSGRTYVVEDYGSALVGRRTIDLYVPTRKQMNAWGRR
ncbi:MAG: 3D domain-containing protein, partial [Verrucomicrobiota bacterium]